MKINITKDKGKLIYTAPMKDLEKWRVENFLTTREFSEKLNIKVRTYYRLLKNPKMKTKIAKAINKFLMEDK